MLKKILFVSFVAILTVILASSALAAPKADHRPDLPEQAGIYEVPGRPDLKLRVFVYHSPAKGGLPGKPDKGDPTVPNEVCEESSVVDLDSSAVVAGAGWVLPGNWEYNLNLKSVPSAIGSENLATIADNAFAGWQEVTGGAVNIERGLDTTISKAQLDDLNIVSWGRAPSTALAVSYIWYNADGIASEVDTIMNKKFTWYWSDPSTWAPEQTCAYEGVYDAQNIMTHEFGHTMGLDDHYTSDYANNTMYGYGSKTETKKNTLTTGDKTGIANIYY